MSKICYGVHVRIPDIDPDKPEQWEVHGLPLRLSEPAVISILEALGITAAAVRRETGVRAVLGNESSLSLTPLKSGSGCLAPEHVPARAEADRDRMLGKVRRTAPRDRQEASEAKVAQRTKSLRQAEGRWH
eukprot:640347-Amphidinium_carterae.3